MTDKKKPKSPGGNVREYRELLRSPPTGSPEASLEAQYAALRATRDLNPKAPDFEREQLSDGPVRYNPLVLIRLMIGMGLYPPPEFLLALAADFDRWFESTGSLSLEKALLGPVTPDHKDPPESRNTARQEALAKKAGNAAYIRALADGAKKSEALRRAALEEFRLTYFQTRNIGLKEDELQEEAKRFSAEIEAKIECRKKAMNRFEKANKPLWDTFETSNRAWLQADDENKAEKAAAAHEAFYRLVSALNEVPE